LISEHSRCRDHSLGVDPEIQAFDIDDPNPSSGHLYEPCMFEGLQRALDHLPYRPDHDRHLVLRVPKTYAGRVLDEGGLPARAIAKQSRHARDHVPKREVFNNHLVGTKARSEQPNHVEADVGMAPQEIEQIGLRKKGDRTVGEGNSIRRKRLIVEHRNVGKRPTRPEDFQHLLTTLQRHDHGSDTPAQDNTESFASVALAEDDVTRPIVAFA
jgi:hypothetical protein